MHLPRRPTWLPLLLVLWTAPLHAQESGIAFLRIGIDAASVAMGDAGVAHSRDAFATYWNPAGLAGRAPNSAALSHLIWVSSVRMYVFTSRFQVGQQGGLGVFFTGTGNAAAGTLDAIYDVQYLNLGAAYGHTIGPVRAGLAAKYLYESAPPNKARGFGIDLGLQVGLLGDDLRFGAALQNLGSMSPTGTDASELPTTLRVGSTVFPLRIIAAGDDLPLLNTFVALDVTHDFASDATQLHVGAAAEVIDLVTVRAGFLSRSEIRSVTLGFGLRYEGFVFDYALIPFRQEYDGLGHMISLLYGW